MRSLTYFGDKFEEKKNYIKKRLQNERMSVDHIHVLLIVFSTYRFIVIIAIQSSETPMLPYWMNGTMRHSKSPCVHVPCMKRNALNGNTNIQKMQSATHKLNKKGFKYYVIRPIDRFYKLHKRTFISEVLLPDNKSGSYISNLWTFQKSHNG